MVSVGLGSVKAPEELPPKLTLPGRPPTGSGPTANLLVVFLIS